MTLVPAFADRSALETVRTASVRLADPAVASFPRLARSVLRATGTVAMFTLVVGAAVAVRALLLLPHL